MTVPSELQAKKYLAVSLSFGSGHREQIQIQLSVKDQEAVGGRPQGH
jgi:hypothetical protein